MTKFGANFIVFFGLLTLMGVATGMREIFFLAFMCGILIAFALISTIFGALTLGRKQTIVTPSVIRNQKARCSFSLRGFTPLPIITTIKIRDFAGVDKTYVGVSFFHKHTTFTLDLLCPHRGEWYAGIVESKFTDMFGFFRLKTTQRKSTIDKVKVTVFPIVYPPPSYPEPHSFSIDDMQYHPTTSDSGDTFSDTRFYRDGDSIKRIHWKMSVRTRELHTRQFETSTEQNVFLLIDTLIPQNNTVGNEFIFDDIACESALVLAQYHIRNGRTVHLIPVGLPEHKITLDSSADVSAAYQMLSFTSLRSATPLAVAAINLVNEIPISSEVILFSREFSDVLMQSMLPLAYGKSKITLLYVPTINSALASRAPVVDNFRVVAIGDAENIVGQIRGFA